MPVETVHLVECHNVEHLLHLVLVEEVTGNVHHETTVLILRIVLDAYQGEAPQSAAACAAQFYRKEFAREQLNQGLQGIELTTET